MNRPTKPQTLPVQFDNIPLCLKQMHRFLGWRWTFNPNKSGHHNGWDKPPINPKTGQLASSTDPETWATYDEVVVFLSRESMDGLGVCLLGLENVVVHDLDNCRSLQTEEISPLAMVIVRAVGGYWEITPSGTGIKGICWGKKTGSRVEASKGGPIDGAQYDGSRGRYVTLSGHTLPESTPDICDAHPVGIEAAYALMFPAKESNPGPRPDPRRVDIDDKELLEKAFSAVNGYKFKRLWAGDTSGYGSDDSAADEALCCLLAYWTGGNEAWMDRLFRQSSLYREKWEREDYRARTIENALGLVTEYYQPSKVSTNGRHTNGYHSATEEAFHGLAADADSEEVRLHITRVADVLSEKVTPYGTSAYSRESWQ
jgi:putative DNA primase/helicase